MTLKTNKRVIFAKLEAVYGVNPGITGANALLVKNIDFAPLDAELVDRALSKPFFGNSEQLLATKLCRLSFDIEMAGAGAAGQIPGYDDVLQACAVQKTVKSVGVAIAVLDGVATVTHNDHGYTGEGNKTTIEDANEADLNGIKAITVIDADTYSFETTEADGAATGAVKCVTGIEYKPISENLKSLAMLVNVDGVLHTVFGSLGTVEANVTVKQIPFFRFSFTGLYQTPQDVAALVSDFSKFITPKIANTQNTPGFELFGYNAPLESATFNIANDVQYKNLIGEESVEIIGRAPTGTLVLKAPRMAEKNFFGIAEEAEKGLLILSHGRRAGEKVIISAPKVSLGNPSYQDSQGTMMLSIPYVPNPDQGNDELTILIA